MGGIRPGDTKGACIQLSNSQFPNTFTIVEDITVKPKET